MEKYLFNRKVQELLEAHGMTQTELSRQISVSRKLISNICRERRSLGALLFIKILRKGFGYSKKDALDIFLKAVKSKYLDCF
jgi:plasmid maintenance system antidote protein VapI